MLTRTLTVETLTDINSVILLSPCNLLTTTSDLMLPSPGFFFFNCDSFHARLDSHFKALINKKIKKRIKPAEKHETY